MGHYVKTGRTSLVMSVKSNIKKYSIEFLKNREKRNRAKYWVGLADNNSKNDLLTPNMKKEIHEYWHKYYKETKIPFSYSFFNFYFDKTGIYDVKFVPDDIYYTYIDPFFNDWSAAKYIDNKCLYNRLFSSNIDMLNKGDSKIKQPVCIANRINDTWIINDVLSNESDVLDSCSYYKEVVIKQATDSEGGHGVFFNKGTDREGIKESIKSIDTDIIIQEPIIQHCKLSKLNPSSVNTIRILTLLADNEVRHLSSIIRMGIGGSRVDNASSGGITCGIDEEGKLKKYAYSASGVKYECHPSTNIIFDNYEVPGYKKALDLVYKLAVYLPLFRLISWDIAIDENANPILLEANLKYGELDFHQLNNGPIFGDRTEKILNMVFSNEDKK